jgi:death-on-curing protein
VLHATITEQAAAYLFHLCMAQPFVDGNKRVAFAAMDTFLRLKGHRLTLSDEEAFELTTAMAGGEIGKDEIVMSITERVVPV